MLLAAVSVAMLVLTALAAPLARRLGRDAGYALAVGFLLVAGLVGAAMPDVLADRPLTLRLPWIPALGVSFALRMDGLSVLFALVVLGVGSMVLAYSSRYLEPTARPDRLFTLLTGFAAAMLGLVLADDVVVLYVFWELTTVCSFFLIATTGKDGARPARRALLVTFGGGLALLAGLVLLVAVTGTTDLTAILRDRRLVAASPLGPAIAALLVVGAATKSAQVPFHFWLPGAMVAITPVSAYLHAATLVKSGVFLLMRFSPLYGERPAWSLALMTVGLVSAVVGALLALKQHDLKALLAYGTVSQVGLLVALVGVGTPLALAAAALHAVAHALFKATLFMLVGIVEAEAGSRDLRRLSGLSRVMPVTSLFAAVAALSMAGVPPLVGFVSKEQAFGALSTAGTAGGTPTAAWVGPVAAGAAVLASVFTFGYGARLVHGAFAGPALQPALRDPPVAFLAPAALPVVADVVFGVGVGWFNPLVRQVEMSTRLVPGVANLRLWPGLTPVLAMSGAAITAGVLLFLARGPVDRVLQRWRLGFGGGGLFDRGYDATLRFGALVGWDARRRDLAAYLAVPMLALAAVAAVLPVATGTLPPPVPGATRMGDWYVVVLLTAVVAGLAVTARPVTALALLGVTGFAVGLWFVRARAVDLALTQLVVEILTVVVAAAVLRRLPARTPPVPRRRVVLGAAVAAAGGAATAGGVWALTGRRGLSPVGGYLLDHSRELTGGRDVVNTVLVDFRGVDTLGEVTVLAVTALAVAVLADRHPAGAGAARPQPPATAEGGADGLLLVLRAATRVVVPTMLAASVYLLLRGHYEPGGGFVAGLVLGAAVATVGLAGGRGALAPGWLPARQVVAAGLALAVATGLAGLLDGAFLRPLRTASGVLGTAVGLTSSLLFDVGVYLVVSGTVSGWLAAVTGGGYRHGHRRHRGGGAT